ncbi:DoxX family protein [Aequorivita sp. H23M31]|uniref:DoxX family protein n=1 Tax=Aequorivita ciconiae TaxID=2494375 RepID=A0A410FZE3_9FLAO|nr:DoxX family protein [Aequorivita sp. H23M31]QAA80388.1 DoxX family protein [Aequorivita sp. H23M31]
MQKSTIHNFGLLFLRVAFSGMLLTHGIPKLLKLLEGDFGFADPIGMGEPISLVLAILGEVVFSLLMIIGYKTRLATIPVIFLMCVAAFVIHGNDPFGTKELSLLYLIAFVSIAILGPGKFSMDRK